MLKGVNGNRGIVTKLREEEEMQEFLGRGAILFSIF